ncbi:MAG: 2-oxo acid dehydrogenase subunit E2 [Streptosporangiales bacterium]|nr:2-oxo acid dehydrogenase subunit E2 [Streptosporangiales bacterium]
MGVKQFKLPDVGEGLTEGEILRWLVQPGDTVEVNQNLVEVETAKVAVELPSPWAGVVSELYVAEGTTVDVGAPIIAIDVTGDQDEDEETEAPLVGYGARATSAHRRPRKSTNGSAPAAAPAPASGQPTPAAAQPQSAPASGSGPAPAGAQPRSPAAAQSAPAAVTVLAKPPVRKLAKDLGVDLRTVTPTGPNGTVSRDDVQAAAAAPAQQPTQPPTQPPAPAPGGAGMPATVPATGWVPELSFANDAREARIPVRGVRKSTAAAMVRSAFTAPHVTEFVTIDATKTMDLVARLKTLPEFAHVKVSPLLLAAKACLLALSRTPIVNSSWDEEAQEIVVRGYVNLGIAAATPRGLMVPNIRGADALSLVGLAGELQQLTEQARAGETAPTAMVGGTFTITNVGIFGVDSGTPILNPGEAGILAVGAIKEQPWVHDGQVVPRMVTTLGLSFDHRIVDGEQGSRFLRDIADFLEDPETRLFAWT